MTSARLTGLVVVAEDVESFRGLMTDVLGGAQDPGADSAGSVIWFDPDVAIEVVSTTAVDVGDDLWADAGEGLHRLVFEVDDPDGVAARLVGLGYRRASGPGRTVLHAAAGMGGALELIEPGSGRTRPPGAASRDGLIRRIDHVCAPSSDLRRSFEVFGGALGGAPVFGGEAPQLGVLTIQSYFGNGMKVETLQPYRDGTAVGGFAQRHPGRFHHLTMLTPDVPEAVERLAQQDWDAIDTDLVSDPDWQETYLRPTLTARVLLQIGATTVAYTEPLDDETMQQVFAGAIDVEKYVMVPK